MTSKFEHYAGDNRFDAELSLAPHFKLFPDMLPWIGQNYHQQGFKLLVVGESHYFNNTAKFHIDPTKWYSRADDDEIKKREGHRIRFQISKLFVTELGKAPVMYRTIEAALREIDYFGKRDIKDEIFQSLAYINYFQRPANTTKQSISVTSQDAEVAHESVLHLINTIKPTAVIFTSKKAWKTASNSQLLSHIECFAAFTAHPRTSWWNRKVKSYSLKAINGDITPLTGRERFIGLIREFSQL